VAKQSSSRPKPNPPKSSPPPTSTKPGGPPPSKSPSGSSKKAAPPAKSQGISPMTLILVAVVAVALVGLAIFYNQQRTAATATPPLALGTPPPSMSDKGIPVGVTADGYPFKGNPDAKVVVQNFSDFQCPFCAQFVASVEPKIEEEFIKTGRIKYVFRDFQFLDRIRQGQPNYDGESHRASLAAHCAQDQGKFWEMHDLIYMSQGKAENAGAFSDANLEKLASSLNLNMDQWRTCFKNNANDVNRLIDRSMNDSTGKQVQGTPTLFVGDRKIEAGSFDTLKAAIELAEQNK